MSRKKFFNFSALAVNGAVELSFYLSTPFFTARQGDLEPLGVRILRREEPDFVFGQDHETYFDGMTPANAEVVFEGLLPLINGRKIVYRDETVRIGKTYVYWVSANSEGDMPTGTAAVRVRDPQIWWPQAEIERRLQCLADNYPQLVQLQEFGQTVRGYAIPGVVAGNSKRVVAFVGNMHPGESGPELMIPALERVVERHADLLEKTGVALLPSVCIDQREKMAHGNPCYLRKNFNEVDLNRNFPAHWEETEYTYGLVTSEPDAMTYRGPAPASEPETRAVMQFIDALQPLCVFSFHCLASICGPCFLTARAAENDSGFLQQCERFITPYTDGFYGSAANKLQLKFGCTAGSLPSWLYQTKNIPGFDLEWEGEERSRIAHTDNTTRELLAEFQDRHHQALVQLLSCL